MKKSPNMYFILCCHLRFRSPIIFYVLSVVYGLYLIWDVGLRVSCCPWLSILYKDKETKSANARLLSNPSPSVPPTPSQVLSLSLCVSLAGQQLPAGNKASVGLVNAPNSCLAILRTNTQCRDKGWVLCAILDIIAIWYFSTDKDCSLRSLKLQ